VSVTEGAPSDNIAPMLGESRVAGKTSGTVEMTSLDESPPFAFGSVAVPRATRLGAGLARIARSLPWAVCLITAVAAALRFAEVDDVSANQFYDAAVRSMSLSWHNFFFGAFDPGGILAVDKPPLDLWLQVLSVKLLGWNASAIKLPEALGGTLAVPLLYDAVRRVAGRPAGLASAVALAVMPESVLTSRSDTMDSVMMLLVVGALWLTVRACQTGRHRWVVLAGVSMGLAFNVKLLESLVAAPALLVLYAMGSQVSWRRKLVDLGLAGASLVTVALSWAIAVSLSPGSHPYPVGSTDGTVWNVMFVFNGFGRVSHAPVSTRPGGPGPLRLVQASGWNFDVFFGCALMAAIAIGGAALLLALGRRCKHGAHPNTMARAFAVSLIVWVVVASALFSHVSVLHTRYLEALAPAVAAAIGFGAASLSGLADRRQEPGRPAVLAIALALGGVCAYTFNLPPVTIAWGAVALTIAAVAAALIATSGGRLGLLTKWLTLTLIIACSVLFPVHESLKLVRAHTNDSLGLATHPAVTEAVLSRYLQPRTTGIRYELAVDEPLALAPMIIHDQRPIFPLTSFHGLPVRSLGQLQTAVGAGEVRYALVGNYTCGPHQRTWASCGPAALWIRNNGIDVSAAAGLTGASKLYLMLPF
jgi:4-amino-4-deoxy-L-arabinose transferase-like glycosyltransferase